MTRRAVGYVRRSSGKESPLSLAAQTTAISTAAADRGESIAETFTDWGKSGGDRSRPAFLEMMEALEAGTISAVYAYDADRLSRRESTLHLLLDAAEDAGAAVVDRTGRDLAGSANRLTAGVLASVDAQVLRDITERNRANRDTKVARGDDLGEAPFGWEKVKLTEPGTNARGEPADAGACVNVCTDPQAITSVLNAYSAAGSALGAARLLNAAGITTKRGHTWGNRAVSDVVAREAPELLPFAHHIHGAECFDGQGRVTCQHIHDETCPMDWKEITKGKHKGQKRKVYLCGQSQANARHYRVRLLSGILRCYCGTVMSPNGHGWTCSEGQRGAHETPYNVTNAKVEPWVRREAERLRVPIDRVEVDSAAERESIEGKRRKLIDLYLDDGIEKVLLDEKMAELDAAVVRLDALAHSQTVPPVIDWEWSTEAINGALRALWDHVELGPDLLPVQAVWRVPEWRA